MVSAWARENRRVLGQRKVDDQSNEITALDMDALNTPTDTVAAILQRGADYVLPVQANQGTLHAELQDLFDGVEADNYQQVVFDTAKQVSEGHDRREGRQCGVVTPPEYHAYLRRAGDWSQLTALVKLMTLPTVEGTTSVQTC